MKLQFNIRDLLWLAIVVALALGWRIDHAQHANAEIEIRHLQKAIEVAKFENETLSRALDHLSPKPQSPK